VVVTFAVDGDTIYTAVDQKPKSTTALRRLRNVGENPVVTMLADLGASTALDLSGPQISPHDPRLPGPLRPSDRRRILVSGRRV
jgi:hypothetical protein